VGGTTVTHSQKKVVAEAGGGAGSGLTLAGAVAGIEVRVWVVGGDSLTTTVEEVGRGEGTGGGRWVSGAAALATGGAGGGRKRSAAQRRRSTVS
jgi:hypothetical protein